jgi:hypothetical protein
MATNGRNNNNNLFNDVSNSDILFINILNTMYNDNLRIIHHLMDQNSEITGQLIDVMNNRRYPANPANPGSNLNTNVNNRSYNRRYRNNNHTTQTTQTTNTNATNTQRRVYIDNIPYYVDNLQLFTIPTSSSNTTTNTNTPTNTSLGNQFSRILNSFLEPINIIPTRTQIENATRNIIYGDILDPINTSCPISLEGFTDTSNVTMIRHCRHIFNTNSLMSWFNSNCKCPVCRYDIRDYNPNGNNNNDNNNNNNNNTQNEEQEDQEENDEVDNNNNPTTNAERQTNTNTNTNTNNNSIEALFVEILTDLSNNDIEYTFDNTSTLFNSLFPINRRRESRR